MNLEGSKKPVTVQNKYETPVLSASPNEDIQYDRFILSLDTDLIAQIEKHVFDLKAKGVKLRDEKTGRYKKINKSLWAREVFTAALAQAEEIK